MMKRLSGLVLLLCLANFLSAQDMRMDTYCNPLNIDYTYMIYNSDKSISYRSGAFPVPNPKTRSSDIARFGVGISIFL